MALFTLASSQRDAEAINLAGSLRMQSYRLGYDIQRGSADLLPHRQAWQQTLNAPALLTLKSWYVPDEVQQRYHLLQLAWQGVNEKLDQGDYAWYQNHMDEYVARIDAFVLSLQHYAEHKIQLVFAISFAGAIGIILLALSTLRRIRQQVVAPLNRLVASSLHIEQGRFDIPVPDTDLPNELGLLSRTFNHMAAELHTLYRSLEISVEEKTHHLHEAHQQLEMLFTCSQEMNTSKIDSHCFRHILQTVREYTGIAWLALHTSDGWKMQEGEAAEHLETQVLPVIMLETRFGELRWQSEQRAVPIPLMKSVATMLGRGLFSNQAQKHYHQLLLMEERATIAR
ncbi:MAG TPA: nitrate/nitrite two-component system sensor histidine kinase NarQ, partial [Leclercia sp.]|nr:nitrate/nitrite two-component system sensor histidine kinase NarQ [Leclercia sp.]